MGFSWVVVKSYAQKGTLIIILTTTQLGFCVREASGFDVSGIQGAAKP